MSEGKVAISYGSDKHDELGIIAIICHFHSKNFMMFLRTGHMIEFMNTHGPIRYKKLINIGHANKIERSVNQYFLLSIPSVKCKAMGLIYLNQIPGYFRCLSMSYHRILGSSKYSEIKYFKSIPFPSIFKISNN